jgi:hypothetical protein
VNRPFGVPALAGPDRLKAGLQTSVSMNLKVGQPSRGPAVAPQGRRDACPNLERAKIVSRLIPDSEFCD